MWNWALLPESEHGAAIEHIEARRWREVAKLCEKYEVSRFCCCNIEGLQAWAKWSVENGILKNGNTDGTAMADHAGRDKNTTI